MEILAQPEAGPSRPPRSTSLGQRPEMISMPSIPQLRSRPSLPSSCSTSPPAVSYINTVTTTSSAGAGSEDVRNADDVHGRRRTRTRKVASEDTAGARDQMGGRTGQVHGGSEDDSARLQLRRVKSLVGETGPNTDRERIQTVESTHVRGGGVSSEGQKQHGSSQSWGGSLVSGAYTAGVYGAALGLTAYRLWSGKSDTPKGAATTSSSTEPLHHHPHNTSSSHTPHLAGHDIAPPPAYEESQAQSKLPSPSAHNQGHVRTDGYAPALALPSDRLTPAKNPATEDMGGTWETSPAVSARKAVADADATRASQVQGRGEASGSSNSKSRTREMGGGVRYASDSMFDAYEGDVFDQVSSALSADTDCLSTGGMGRPPCAMINRHGSADQKDPFRSDHASSPYTNHNSTRTPLQTSHSTPLFTKKKAPHQHPLLHNTPGRQFGRVYRKRFGTFESSLGHAKGSQGGQGVMTSRDGGSLSGSASGSISTCGSRRKGAGVTGQNNERGRRRGLQGVFDTPTTTDIPTRPTYDRLADTATNHTGASDNNVPDGPAIVRAQAQAKEEEDERILEQLDEMGYRIQRLIMEGQDALALKPGDLISPSKRAVGGSRGRGRGRGRGSQSGMFSSKGLAAGDRRMDAERGRGDSASPEKMVVRASAGMDRLSTHSSATRAGEGWLDEADQAQKGAGGRRYRSEGYVYGDDDDHGHHDYNHNYEHARCQHNVAGNDDDDDFENDMHEGNDIPGDRIKRSRLGAQAKNEKERLKGRRSLPVVGITR